MSFLSLGLVVSYRTLESVQHTYLGGLIPGVPKVAPPSGLCWDIGCLAMETGDILLQRFERHGG